MGYYKTNCDDSMVDIRFVTQMSHGLFILFKVLKSVTWIKVGTCPLINHYSNFHITFLY